MSEATRTKMEQLVTLAEKRRVAELHYRKHLTNTEPVPRLVEPYNFTRGQQDVILRCYQLEPDPGWRFFMIHKIDRIEDGGTDYQPRVRVMLDMDHAQGESIDQPGQSWSDRVRRYRDLVSDAMADGVITREELAQIDQLKRDSGLSAEERDYVHAALFHRCLGAIVEDGEVTRPEKEQIQFLKKVLEKLGWGVVD